MDIRETGNTPALQPAPRVSSEPRGLKPEATNAEQLASPRDRAEVSVLAASVADSAMQPDVRQEKVAALQQQLAGGTYEVSPAAVADALLRNFVR